MDTTLPWVWPTWVGSAPVMDHSIILAGVIAGHQVSLARGELGCP